MAALIIEHDGRRHSFDGSRPVVIGRDASCDVTCDNPAVSRIHVRVALEAGRWTVTDESSLGTFSGHERVRRLPIDRPVTLRLGDPTAGEALRLLVDDPFDRPRPLEHGTVLVPKDATDGVDRLVVQVDGREVVARSGEVLRVGRDPGSEVRVDDPIVSRRHARISQRGDRWVIEDTGSSRGTFVGGVRVEQADLAGRTTVTLGDPAGPALVCTVGADGKKGTGSGAGPRRRWVRYAVPAAAAVVLLVGLAAFLLRGGGGADGLTEAKRASVWLVVRYPGGGGTRTTGSGTLVSANGLILTSAHVAARDASGLAPSYPSGDPAARPAASQAPDRVDVYTYVSDDRIELRYQAEVVVADGYLDLAVLKIDRDADGAGLEEGSLDLPHVSLGDSAAVETGEDAHVLGFPDAAQASSVSVYREAVDSFGSDPLVGTRAWIQGGAEKVSPGSSGGALVDGVGHLIGVTTDVAASGPPRVDYRPSNLAKPLVDAATSGSSESYASQRYVKAAAGGSSFQFRGVGSQPACKPSKPVVGRAGPLPYVYLDYADVAKGQAVYVRVTSAGGGDELGGAWILFTDQPTTGCAAWRVSVPAKAYADPDLAAIEVHVSVGPSFEDLEDRPPATLLLLSPAPPPGGG